MVEVFRTSVQSVEEETLLLDKLQKEFSYYKINFDLEGCDNILRIESIDNIIDPNPTIKLVRYYGFDIEVLEDVVVKDKTVVES
ncbi:hypothetical protein C7448_102222 [Tenacibaculum gallaicum]|uniref:Uncharacterized protein n=1 Tax=Tenacibaculum gallaicum TaxID=561505 RepID=A0A3E0I7S9_9FLAO|nr:hypothetical protein [Tenacibaculum gallaicum]REH54699.1 hypothetical protein C7448_102222 [Tenacibaculum gallaicum]